MKKIIIYILIAAALIGFFSYKLTQVPNGITPDEGAFGYNGVLLSRTLRDENGRHFPIFVLSLGESDWRQPVTQYFITFIFRVLGPSLFNLRLTAVLTTVASIFLIYFLGKKLLENEVGGIVAAVLLGTTPIILIQSHLGLDNITLVPFVLGWLFALFLYTKTKKNFWLTLSAVAIGIGFYSYKGMRIYVPVWVIATLVFLAKDWLIRRNKKTFRSSLKSILYFAIPLVPFFAIIPFLEYFYSGAVLNNEHLVFEGFYKLFYPYLAAFDPSFLFIKGDDLLYHSTGIHGMYLLASLPFFIFGLIYSWKKSAFWKFIIICFFAGPLLFGLLGSVHRASRMLEEVPLYALISAFGFVHLWKQKTKLVLAALIIVFAINYFDFLHYYLWDYGPATEHIFNCFSCSEIQYKTLKNDSTKLNLVPFVDSVSAKSEGETEWFARSIYFPNKPNLWDGDKNNLPKDGILMTDNSNIKYLKLIDHVGGMYYYTY